MFRTNIFNVINYYVIVKGSEECKIKKNFGLIND